MTSTEPTRTEKTRAEKLIRLICTATITVEEALEATKDDPESQAAIRAEFETY